jgi:hypothetical protein
MKEQSFPQGLDRKGAVQADFGRFSFWRAAKWASPDIWHGNAGKSG